MTTTGKTASIGNALNYQLAQLTLSPARRIAWPNASFTPVANEIYLRPRFMPNRTDHAAVGVNAPSRHRGIYQIEVVGPARTPAPETQDEVVDAVIEHFKGQTIARNGVRVRIGSFDGSPGIPYRGSSLTVKGWAEIAVTIPWWCDTF